MFGNMIQKIISANIVLAIITIILTLWLPLIDAARLVFGSLATLFLPGFFISWAVFPLSEPIASAAVREKLIEGKTLDLIERITLAVPLSIAITLIMIYTFSVLPPAGTHTYTKTIIVGIIIVNVITAIIGLKRYKNYE